MRGMNKRMFPAKGTAYAKAWRNESGWGRCGWGTASSSTGLWLREPGVLGWGSSWCCPHGPCSHAEQVGLRPKGSVQSCPRLDLCLRNISLVNMNWGRKRMRKEAVALLQVRHNVAFNVCGRGRHREAERDLGDIKKEAPLAFGDWCGEKEWCL